MPQQIIRIKTDTGDSNNRIRQLENHLRRLEGRIQSIKSSASNLASILTSMVTVISIRQILEYADAWTLAGNRIRIISGQTEGFAAIQQELFQIAQRSRAEFNALAEVYQRIGRSTTELGVSQKEVLEVVELIAKTVAISGVTSRTASMALIQLGQGFASAVIRGDELRSVLEQLPALALAIARGLGITIGQLRRFGLEGKLTAKAVFEAIQSQEDWITEQFSRVKPTINQSFEVFNNSLRKFIGETMQASGASEALAESIIAVGRELEEYSNRGDNVVTRVLHPLIETSKQWVVENYELTKSLGAVASGGLSVLVGLVLLGGAVNLLVFTLSPLVTLFAFLLTTLAPWVVAFTAAAAVLGIVGAAVYGLRERFFDLGDAVAASAKEVIADVTSITDVFAKMFPAALEKTESIIERIFRGMMPDKVWDQIKRTASLLLTVFGPVVEGIINLFLNMAQVISQTFLWILDTVAKVADAIPAQLLAAIGKATSGEKVSSVEWINAVFSLQNMEDPFKIWRKGLLDISDTNKDIMENLFKENDLVQTIKEQWPEIKGDAVEGMNDLWTVVKEGWDRVVDLFTFDPLKELKVPDDKTKPLTILSSQQETEYERLIKKIDPMKDAITSFINAEDLLRQAHEAELISTEKLSEYLERLKHNYEGLIEPTRAMSEQQEVVTKMFEASQRFLEEYNKRLEAGEITSEKYGKLISGLYSKEDLDRDLANIVVSFSSLVSPIQSIKKELETEINLAGMLEDARRVEDIIIKIQNTLEKRGEFSIDASQFRGMIESMLQLEEATKRTDQLIKRYQDPYIEYQKNVKALSRAFDEGAFSAERYKEVLRMERFDFLGTQKGFMPGFERGILRGLEELTDVGPMVEDLLVSPFLRAEDAIVGALTGIEGAIDQAIRAIGTDFLRLGVRALITGPLFKAAFGKAIPGLAEGGTAFSGRPHLVGEKGPELFVPDRTGTVVSASMLQRLVGNVTQSGGSDRNARSSQGNSIGVTIYMQGDQVKVKKDQPLNYSDRQQLRRIAKALEEVR